MSEGAGPDSCVCLKQVPDPHGKLVLRTDGSWIDESDLAAVLSESDECALEEAIRIRERVGGSVTALSLGPDETQGVLRRALALGADRGVHLRSAAPVRDPQTVAALLARAIRELGPFQLVLTGAQSQDFGSCVTGTVLAALLEWAHSWLVIEVRALGADSLEAVRELENRARQVDRLPLPAVLQIQAGINQPRMAKIRDVIAARKKELEVVECEQLCGDRLGGAPPRRIDVVRLVAPSASDVRFFEGPCGTAAAELVAALRQDCVVPEPRR